MYIYIYIHTYIHTYIHAYIHTYIHDWPFWALRTHPSSSCGGLKGRPARKAMENLI